MRAGLGGGLARAGSVAIVVRRIEACRQAGWGRARATLVPAGRPTALHLSGTVASAALYTLVLWALLQGYSLFRKTYFVRPPEVAVEHARQVMGLQRALGIDVSRVEIPLQQWVLAHPRLVDAFNLYYQNMKPALLLCAALCAFRARAAFGQHLRVFLLATIIALPWYAIYPLAPPRLMAEHGYAFVDTLAVYGGVRSSAAGLGGANQYAALPSMHIGWTAIAALWLAAAIPWRQVGRLLGCAHVALMSVAVVVTGNHYVIDIVAGLAVAAAAWFLASVLPGIPWRWSVRPTAGQPAPAHGPVARSRP